MAPALTRRLLSIVIGMVPRLPPVVQSQSAFSRVSRWTKQYKANAGEQQRRVLDHAPPSYLRFIGGARLPRGYWPMAKGTKTENNLRAGDEERIGGNGAPGPAMASHVDLSRIERAVREIL